MLLYCGHTAHWDAWACAVLHPLPFLQVPATSDCSCIESEKIIPGAFPALSTICAIRVLETSRQNFHQFPLILRVSKDSSGGAEEQKLDFTIRFSKALFPPLKASHTSVNAGGDSATSAPPLPWWCVLLEAPGGSSLCTLLCEDCSPKEISGHCK